MLENKINLLVIDDDDINIFIIKKIVEKTGFEVDMMSKNNGQQAMEYIEDSLKNNIPLPNLMLIDLNMPLMNGWEFLEAYGKLNINQKVDMYILSSSVYENDIEKTKSYATIKGFISKPLSTERLTELIKDLRY